MNRLKDGLLVWGGVQNMFVLTSKTVSLVVVSDAKSMFCFFEGGSPMPTKKSNNHEGIAA